MTIKKKITALAICAGLTFAIAGGVSTTVHGADVLFVPNGMHNHCVQMRDAMDSGSRQFLIMQIFRDIINQLALDPRAIQEFVAKKEKTLQENIEVFEKYLAERFEKDPEFEKEYMDFLKTYEQYEKRIGKRRGGRSHPPGW